MPRLVSSIFTFEGGAEQVGLPACLFRGAFGLFQLHAEALDLALELAGPLFGGLAVLEGFLEGFLGRLQLAVEGFDGGVLPGELAGLLAEAVVCLVQPPVGFVEPGVERIEVRIAGGKVGVLVLQGGEGGLAFGEGSLQVRLGLLERRDGVRTGGAATEGGEFRLAGGELGAEVFRLPLDVALGHLVIGIACEAADGGTAAGAYDRTACDAAHDGGMVAEDRACSSAHGAACDGTLLGAAAARSQGRANERANQQRRFHVGHGSCSFVPFSGTARVRAPVRPSDRSLVADAAAPGGHNGKKNAPLATHVPRVCAIRHGMGRPDATG
jgi:hypothetical protein